MGEGGGGRPDSAILSRDRISGFTSRIFSLLKFQFAYVNFHSIYLVGISQVSALVQHGSGSREQSVRIHAIWILILTIMTIPIL